MIANRANSSVIDIKGYSTSLTKNFVSDALPRLKLVPETLTSYWLLDEFQFDTKVVTEGIASVKVNLQSPKHLASSEVFRKTSAFTYFPVVVTV